MNALLRNTLFYAMQCQNRCSAPTLQRVCAATLPYGPLRVGHFRFISFLLGHDNVDFNVLFRNVRFKVPCKVLV